MTFNADIAPILFEHCGSCHRPGQQAPFSLLEYQAVRSHARLIATVTGRRLMPPWLPERDHGKFLNERRLSDAQIRAIQQWVDQGAIEGDPLNKPPIPEWPEGWQLGQPDLILTLPQPYTLRPDGTDVFRNFVIPMPVSSTRYVRAIEFHPDNPRVLHHATVGIDPSRSSRQLARDDPEPGFSAMSENQVKVFGWSPGKAPFMEPADRAWLLEGGSDLILEMHMLPTGKPEVIQPTIGLFFTTTPPARVPLLIKLESETIDIPPRETRLCSDRHLRPAGGRGSPERLSARALPGKGRERVRHTSRRHSQVADLDQGLGLQVAGSISLRGASVPSERNDPDDALHVRQLG